MVFGINQCGSSASSCSSDCESFASTLLDGATYCRVGDQFSDGVFFSEYRMYHRLEIIAPLCFKEYATIAAGLNPGNYIIHFYQ